MASEEGRSRRQRRHHRLVVLIAVVAGVSISIGLQAHFTVERAHRREALALGRAGQLALAMAQAYELRAQMWQVRAQAEAALRRGVAFDDLIEVEERAANLSIGLDALQGQLERLGIESRGLLDVLRQVEGNLADMLARLVDAQPGDEAYAVMEDVGAQATGAYGAWVDRFLQRSEQELEAMKERSHHLAREARKWSQIVLGLLALALAGMFAAALRTRSA